MSLSKAVRNNVWTLIFGEIFKGSCQVCSREIKITEYECGHIISKAKGGLDDIDNLLPICRPCNNSMKTSNLYAYKTKYYPSENLKEVLPGINKCSRQELIELQAYLEELISNERDIRAERRAKEKEKIEEQPTGTCEYRFIKGPRIGLLCGKDIYDSEKYCSNCRIKKHAK